MTGTELWLITGEVTIQRTHSLQKVESLLSYRLRDPSICSLHLHPVALLYSKDISENEHTNSPLFRDTIPSLTRYKMLLWGTPKTSLRPCIKPSSKYKGVKIVKEVPKDFASLPRAWKHFTLWSGIGYYEEMTQLWKDHQVIHVAKSDSRLANNDLQLLTFKD